MKIKTKKDILPIVEKIKKGYVFKINCPDIYNHGRLTRIDEICFRNGNFYIFSHGYNRYDIKEAEWNEEQVLSYLRKQRKYAKNGQFYLE